MNEVRNRRTRSGPSRRRGSPYPINPLRRLLFGYPTATTQADHTRLTKLVALPVFASDAISSSTYATQEVMLVLGAAGLWLTHPELYRTLPVAIACGVAALLAIVVVSYWQTIHAYPSGGGSYIVSKDNLGPFPGLVAAAALLMDYVLTVAVSIAAGVQNLLDMPIASRWSDSQVPVCIIAIALLCFANLRGLRESGTVFAGPTYMFIVLAAVMIATGLVGPIFGLQLHTGTVTRELPQYAYTASDHLSVFAIVAVVLKAFASGCAAMTGTEAVSNGIPAFRRPESRNAAITLTVMAVILGALFIGFASLAARLGVVYGHHGSYTSPAVIEQISGAVFGRGSALYYLMQFSTAGILVLAANTAFADFPRLAAILSRDRYMPRQLANKGDKLVFSNGIALLACAAVVLIVGFHGSVDRLIPLYAVGVFTAFTLSQSGMVRHWLRERGPHWLTKAMVNGFGALCTGIVLAVISIEKFHAGAWVVVVVVSALIAGFSAIYRHYAFVRNKLSIGAGVPTPHSGAHTVLVLIPSLHRGVFPAIYYARRLSPDCRAIHIELEPNDTQRLVQEWEANMGDEMPLVVLPSPFRSLIGPLMAYLDQVQIELPDNLVTVVLPEFVSTKWWHSFLHNANGPLVKLYLSQRPGVVLVNVRYFIGEPEQA